MNQCETRPRRKRRIQFHFLVREWNYKSWQEKIQKFAHPNKFGKFQNKVEERSSDHPGEEDDESNLAGQQPDAMEAESDFGVFLGKNIYLSTSCSRATNIICASRKLISYSTEIH